jgi:Carboxypeptidase regulatory-like domain
MRRVALSTVIAAAITLLARAQSTAITGRVVADESGDPIPNARVALSTAALGTPVVLTDGDRRFALTAPPGRQSIVASKSGYARSEGTPAIVGQPMEIRLRRSVTISGRVVDEFGDPVVMARVSARSRTIARSRRRAHALSRSRWIATVGIPPHASCARPSRDPTARSRSPGFHTAATMRPPSRNCRPKEKDAWQDPAFLESLVTRASSITLGDAQKLSLSLRLAPR